MLSSIANVLAETSVDGASTTPRVAGLSSERWEMAMTLAGQSHNLRLTTATRRLVERVFGEAHPESHFAAQIAMARLVAMQTRMRHA